MEELICILVVISFKLPFHYISFPFKQILMKMANQTHLEDLEIMTLQETFSEGKKEKIIGSDI